MKVKELLNEACKKGLTLPFLDWSNNEQLDFLTLCVIQKWLREVHNIHIDISIAHPLSYSLGVYIINKKCFVIQNYYYDTYEEALEFGLYEALKLINNESKTS